MIRSLAKIILHATVKRENLSRKRQFMGWENINHIALLVDAEECSDKRTLDKFIDETKKHVEVYFLEPGAKEASYHDWHCLSKKDKNFFHLPKKNTFQELKNKRFDVCINTCDKENLFSESLHAVLNAPLKCGPHLEHNISDLVIRKTEPTNLINYLNEVVRYLKMIRN